MIDKTITSALLHLRAQIIRGNLDGLVHVEALLIARGVDPAGQYVPTKKASDSAKRRGVRSVVLAALQDGPKRPAQIGALFMAEKPGLDPKRAMIRVYRAIYKMRDRGVVRREGRLWLLTRLAH